MEIAPLSSLGKMLRPELIEKIRTLEYDNMKLKKKIREIKNVLARLE